MKTLNKFSLLAGLVALCAAPLYGQLIASEPVASVDNIPPAPVTNLLALDASDDAGNRISLTWSLSIDDAVTFTSFGNTFVPRGGVQGYNIYRQPEDGTEELVATLGPGIAEFIDEGAEEGITYIYSVHPFDLDNETALGVDAGSAADLARIVLIGGTPDVEIVITVQATVSFEGSLDTENETAVELFTNNFIATTAALMGIDPSRVVIEDIRPGSIIVDFVILEAADPTAEAPVAAEALAVLLEEIETGTEVFVDAGLGAVLDIVDETKSEVVIVVRPVLPVDADGNEIVSWFSRIGRTVSFQDFFSFADHFGTRETSANWDPIYDIVPNGSVDFQDFFRFADDFGKTIVNADAVKSHEGLL